MPWSPKNCVVVPIDFSSASDVAIQTALEITGKAERVHVVHVASPPTFLPYAGEVIPSVDLSRWVELAEQHLADYLKARPQFVGVCSKVLEGDAGARIAEIATAVHSDLIVMPSHGYHGVKRFLLGSVAEAVLRHAPCEVLVLRRAD
ncbi:MAG: universal stress protein [Planctomycetia bacterium]|nr:universal stress protein [Planctomycetia bacterium]